MSKVLTDHLALADTSLPRTYDKPRYEQKCSALFEHIYESYPKRNASVYLMAS
jgi:type I restriction enzyme R subunit